MTRTWQEVERDRGRGISLARQVSALLRRAGFTKAGPYRLYQQRNPGFLVHGRHNKIPTAGVLSVGEDRLAEYKEVLLADGRYVVKEVYGSLYVQRAYGLLEAAKAFMQALDRAGDVRGEREALRAAIAKVEEAR